MTITEEEVVSWLQSSEVSASLVEEYEKSVGVITEENYCVV